MADFYQTYGVSTPEMAVKLAEAHGNLPDAFALVTTQNGQMMILFVNDLATWDMGAVCQQYKPQSVWLYPVHSGATLVP